MAKFTLSKQINAPLATVFGVFTDFEHCSGRIKAITKIEMETPGPVGVGTRFKETRVMFGKPCTEEMSITAFEQDRSYEITALSCGAEFRTQFHFTPDAGGTRVDVAMQTRALTFAAKLMKPMAWLMSGMMKKCVDQDVEDLKKVAEEAGAAGMSS